MKWYRRLAFKIFFSIWGVSALVLFGSLALISTIAEEELVEAKVKGFAHRVIDRYELIARIRDTAEDSEKVFSREERISRKDREVRGGRLLLPSPPEVLRIASLDSGRVLLEQQLPQGMGDVRVRRAKIKSDSGEKYLIQYHTLKNKRGDKLLRFLVSVQALLVLIASIISAVVLTWIVVRPINRLRMHTRSLYETDLDTRAAPALVRRDDEIGHLAREFDQMADFVQTTLDDNQRLLQDVSHELRAPLARLQASVGLAEQKLGYSDASIERINRECVRLDRLIGEILTFSRLGQARQAKKLFDANNVLDETLRYLIESEPTRQFRLRLDEGKAMLKGDDMLFERAISNVITNAIKYSDSAIDIETKIQPKVFYIQIRDYGQGVPEDQLIRLFEPFYRASGSGDGYGLGLSIVKRAIEYLNGKVWLDNHPDGGLIVNIELPVVTA
ncbi:MAG: ATP-binding protein [Pontibacterium sp.]